jgi:hypothetical protein
MKELALIFFLHVQTEIVMRPFPSSGGVQIDKEVSRFLTVVDKSLNRYLAKHSMYLNGPPNVSRKFLSVKLAFKKEDAS